MNGGEDLMTYNDFLKFYNAIYYDVKKLWTYEKVIDHGKDSGGQHEVQYLWGTGKTHGNI